MYGHSLQTYREYHSDIYPETNGYLAAMGPDDWWKSKCNNPVPKISLDPKKRPKTNLSHFNGKPLGERDSTIKNDNPVSPPQPVKPLPSGPVDSKVRSCLIFCYCLFNIVVVKYLPIIILAYLIFTCLWGCLFVNRIDALHRLTCFLPYTAYLKTSRNILQNLHRMSNLVLDQEVL